MLYGRLDRLRDRAAGRLAEVLAAPGGTDQARSERDSFAADLSRRIVPARRGRERAVLRPARLRRRRAPVHRPDRHLRRRRRLRAAAGGLAGAGGPAVLPRHRGLARRACAAAGTSAPGCAGWSRLDDEVLDLALAGRRRAGGLAGEAALLAALERQPHRPDARHRRDHPGRAGPDHPRRARRRAGRAGRPGTGKTAVALHRAAYLLYTYREQLATPRRADRRAERDVPALHRQVLPSLGETGVLLATLGDLVPRGDRRPGRAGRGGRGQGPAASGRRARRRGPATGSGCPDGGLELVDCDGEPVRLDRPDLPARPGTAARRSRRPHNVARRSSRPSSSTRWPTQVAAAARRRTRRAAHLLAAGDLADIRARAAGRAAGVAGARRAAGRCSPRSGCSPTCTPPGPAGRRRARAARGRAGAAAPRARRRLDPGRRAAAGRGGRAARRGRPGRREPGQARRRRGRAIAVRRGRAGHPGRVGRARADDLEDDWEAADLLTAVDLIDAERLAERHDGGRTAHRGRAGRRRPDLGVRARHRGRGAGAVADGLAAADAALPEPVDDDGRRRGADRRPGRHVVLGAGARAVRGGPVAAGRADRQLPHPGRDHGGGRRRAGRDRPGAAAAPVGAGDRRRSRGTGRVPPASWPPRWSPRSAREVAAVGRRAGSRC